MEEYKVEEENTLRFLLKDKKESYYNILKANIDILKPILAKCTPPEYTGHAYDNHTLQVEKYVNDLLKQELKDILDPTELFILLTAIHCHDIGMSKYDTIEIDGRTYSDASRGDHNQTAYEMLYDNNKHTDLITYPPDCDADKFAKTIAELCRGHRNHKDEQGKPIDTLKDLEDNNFTNTKFKTKFFASILRLADELDITNQRAPQKILNLIVSWLNNQSKEEWRKHSFYEQVDIKSDSLKITLKPNKQQVELSDKSSDKTQIRHILFKIRDTIEETLKEIEPYIKVEILRQSFDIDYSIKYDYDVSIITKEDYENYKNNINKKKEQEKAQDIGSSEAQEENIEIVKESIKRIVTKLKNRGELISYGNIVLPTERRSRYYINTNLLIPRYKFLGLIISYFYLKHKDNNIDCVIGIGDAGRIIGPRLSIRFHSLFTYPTTNSREENSSISVEKDTLFDKENDIQTILVITDVLSSGQTIKTVNSIICKKKPLAKIYYESIFSVNNEVANQLMTEGIVVESINNSFQFDTYTEEDINDEKNKKLKNELDLLRKIKR